VRSVLSVLSASLTGAAAFTNTHIATAFDGIATTLSNPSGVVAKLTITFTIVGHYPVPVSLLTRANVVTTPPIVMQMIGSPGVAAAVPRERIVVTLIFAATTGKGLGLLRRL
jgi:hypothetical protein